MWQHQVRETADRQEAVRLRLLSVGILAAGWAVARALPLGGEGSPAMRAGIAALLALAGWFSAYHLGERRLWPTRSMPANRATRMSTLVTLAPLGALVLLAGFGLGALPMIIVGGLLLLALEQLD